MQGVSKRRADRLTGLTDTMKRVVFADAPMPVSYSGGRGATGSTAAGHTAAAGGSASGLVRAVAGDYVAVEIVAASSGTLRARPLARTSLREFVGVHGSAAPLPVRMAADAGSQLLRAVG